MGQHFIASKEAVASFSCFCSALLCSALSLSLSLSCYWHNCSIVRDPHFGISFWCVCVSRVSLVSLWIVTKSRKSWARAPIYIRRQQHDADRIVMTIFFKKKKKEYNKWQRKKLTDE
nr:hypothetical protein [Pandoravirus aubagnensis]